MNRKAGIVAGLAALGLMGYLGSRLIADPPARPTAPAAPHTRIAVFNLSYVIEHYTRFEDFVTATKTEVQSYDKQLEPMVNDMKKISEVLQKETNVTKQKELTAKMKKLDRDIKEIQESGKDSILTKEAANYKAIYKDVEEAVRRYSVSHGIELVMHYNDFTGEKRDTPQNVRNKLGYAGCFPMFSAPGMDITRDVLTMLNGSSTKTSSTGGTRKQP